MTQGFVSIEAAVAAAEQASAAGRYPEAAAQLRLLLERGRDAATYEYDDWVRRLAEIETRLGHRWEAGFLHLYLHYTPLARQTFPPEAALERARTLLIDKQFPEAAAEFLAAGRPVQAAVAWESAGRPAETRAAWTALAGERRLSGASYERALIQLNLGLAVLRDGDRPAGLGHLVASQRLLEQVADDFETAGARDRAFDCYQILLKTGRDSGAFENLAEGYLNCIRILREDGLKTHALSFYEDFVGRAVEAGELHAAATLLREAADYAQRVGLPYHADYLRRSAATWVKEAEAALARGAAAEMAENAFLASVDCLSLAGDLAGVAGAYRRLAALDLREDRRARYAAIAERFADAPAAAPEGPRFPEYMRPPPLGEIWFEDLVEWEMDGDPAEVAGAIVADLARPDTVRRAALAVLLANGQTAPAAQPNAAPLVAVAEHLGATMCYAALRPLERLYTHPGASVRRAAVAALGKLFFKRSFRTLSVALADPDSAVREAATAALTGMHFPHAFQPLARIFDDVDDPRVKRAALETIGKIGSLEAGEMLVSVLRRERGPLRDTARHALAGMRLADLTPILRGHLEIETDPELQGILAELVRAPRGR
jgi:hypothetical protein